MVVRRFFRATVDRLLFGAGFMSKTGTELAVIGFASRIFLGLAFFRFAGVPLFGRALALGFELVGLRLRPFIRREAFQSASACASLRPLRFCLARNVFFGVAIPDPLPHDAPPVDSISAAQDYQLAAFGNS